MFRIIILTLLIFGLLTNNYAAVKPFLIDDGKIMFSIKVEQDEIELPEFFIGHFEELVSLGWGKSLIKTKNYTSKNCFFIYQVLQNTWVSEYIKLNKKLVRYQTAGTFAHVILVFSDSFYKNFFVEWKNGSLYFFIKLYGSLKKEVMQSNIQALLVELRKFAKKSQKYRTVDDELVLPGKLHCIFSAKYAIFPFLFKINTRQYGGYDLYIAEKIARILKVEVVSDYTAQDFDEIVQKVQQGQADIGFFVSASFERSSRVVFIPYFYFKQCIILNQTVTQCFKKAYLKKLNNKKSIIYVKAGTVYREFAQYKFPEAVILDFSIPIVEQYEQIIRKKNTFIGIFTNELRFKANFRDKKPFLYTDKDNICLVVNIKAGLLANVIREYINREGDYSFEEINNMFIGGQL